MVTTAPEAARNGKNAKDGSPNGNGSKISDLTPETSSDDDSCYSKKNLGKKKSEFEEKIRVGKDYQVIVPEISQRPESYPDKALLVWSPVRDIPESKLDEYIKIAKESYSYNAEQALGMLFWHKHDLEKAVTDLANFTPFPDEWTKEDKVMFEQAFNFHGKSFNRIRQMLPDKSIASLVKFYYSWKKKERSRASMAERLEKKKKERGYENGSENGSPEDSDVEKIDSDDDVVQVKDAEVIGNINEIIGDNCADEGAKTGKTSIMTTSTGKTLKRKHDEAEESSEKKLATESVTITPIEKKSTVSV